jgi:7,8-dihydro-6-hydroxymethylpterin dimethyltransferase
MRSLNILETVPEPKETVLKTTTSRCPVCEKPKPAQVIRLEKDGKEQVVMRRSCDCHGTHDFVISSDPRFYSLAMGNREGGSCGCGPACSTPSEVKQGTLGINATDLERLGNVEKLSTCLALIEIVDSCNLTCPTCFASSLLGFRPGHIDCHDFDDVTSRIQGVIDRKGHIEIIQFSGGEPTLHPEFFRLVRWVRSNPNIDYLLINTNGIRFAKDEEFVRGMGELFKEFDNIQLYLQFDGPQEEGQLELRGADLRKIRRQAIENCAKVGIPVTLAMTVNEHNLPYVWDTVDFGRKYPNVRGVSFQPMFISGRSTVVKQTAELPQPITAADIILGLESHSKKTLSFDDFTPLPCGDPNCATIGWLFRMGSTFYSPTKFGVDIAALQGTLPDRMNYSIEDLKKCGCDNTALGDLMRKLEMKESNAFRLFIKPFMDVRTWDGDRIDRCCTHVIRPDGDLESFCSYYGPKPVGACC